MLRVIESSLKALSNVVERDGRYFIQCLDGEIETTPAEIKQRQKSAQDLQKSSDTWQRLYGHQKWKGNKIPSDAEHYVNIKIAFETIQEWLQERYNAGDRVENLQKICDVAILQIEQELSNPHTDTKKLNAWLVGWQAMKKFLELFPKREAEKAILPPSSDTKQPEPDETKPKQANFSLRQIALLQIYKKGPKIQRDQRADELAQQYGHRSGAKLYDYYRKLSKQTGITGLEGSELPQIIADIQTILPFLSDAHKQDACDVLQTLIRKQQQI